LRHFVLGDPCDRDGLKAILVAAKPGIIFHLAGTWQAGSVETAYQINTVFAANLLDAARDLDVPPTIILAGTAAEYGVLPPGCTSAHEDVPCQPATLYGISKLAQTFHGLAAARQGMPVVIARLFNPVGRSMSESLAIGSFIAQIERMGPEGGVLRTGDLDVVRDFIAVEDACRLFVDLAFCPDALGQIVNICTGQDCLLADLVRRLIVLAGRPVRHEIDLSRNKADSIPRFVGSPEKLRALGLTVPGFDMDAVLTRSLTQRS
jgi:GDP-4-dehydro-6-deoxy-D-mannose reductase